jgi:hypothetical protein
MGVNGHVQLLSSVVLLKGVPTGVIKVSNQMKQCVSSNHVKPSIFVVCIIPQLIFYPSNDKSLCFKDVDGTHP